ncbi:MAG TPA: hypothetical protein ENK18_02610, partial [Deltaproteobacteria bacterium]|nr:hypothetical protein [Deltaproteobacteria bacterium]
MSEATVALAAGCLLQIAETQLSASEGGWIEETHLEVAADPTCPWIVWPLPRGARLEEAQAKTRLGDGTHTRLGSARWEHGAPHIDGTIRVTLHLPELLSGDRVVIDVVRRWPEGPLSWRPGAARYWRAELRDRSGALQLEATGDVRRHPRRPRIWTTDAPEALAAQLIAPE